jgi:hypothetical protein
MKKSEYFTTRAVNEPICLLLSAQRLVIILAEVRSRQTSHNKTALRDVIIGTPLKIKTNAYTS